MSARLLLVDDHPLFRDGFAVMVAAARPDWSVAMADTAEAACARLRAGEPFDAAIVDIRLPDRDGFSALSDMAQIRPDVARIIISGREDLAARLRARHSGASGYIDKAAEPAEIVDMIERVLEGGTAFEVRAATDPPDLTPRQAEVLELLAEGCPNKEIQFRLGIAERTVRAHLTELFAALGAHSRMQALLRARELGLIR